MQIAQSIDFKPAIIEVSGKTKTERQLSVVSRASTQTKFALANAKGKVGIIARAGVARAGLGAIAESAAKGNYNPAAEYFAARHGQPMVITNRASFDSLPDLFESSIMKAKMAKNGGYVEDKKTGAMKPSPAHALALELKAIAVELIAHKESIIAERQAEAQAIEA